MIRQENQGDSLWWISHKPIDYPNKPTSIDYNYHRIHCRCYLNSRQKSFTVLYCHTRIASENVYLATE